MKRILNLVRGGRNCFPRSCAPAFRSPSIAAAWRMPALFICCLFVLASAVPLQAEETGDNLNAATEEQASPAEVPVAVVNEQPIRSAELDAHMALTGLSREEALEDLIDITLIRIAAAENDIKTPAGKWSAEERAGIELALAQALTIEAAEPRVMLVVDHAWLKLSENEEAAAAGHTLMERLKSLVEAGATIPTAFARLKVDGNAWHIGDHEEYPYDSVPDEARDLPPETLSPIIEGEGGIHLFVIHKRREIPPSIDAVRGPLREMLRDGAFIERPEQENQ